MGKAGQIYPEENKTPLVKAITVCNIYDETFCIGKNIKKTKTANKIPNGRKWKNISMEKDGKNKYKSQVFF